MTTDLSQAGQGPRQASCPRSLMHLPASRGIFSGARAGRVQPPFLGSAGMGVGYLLKDPGLNPAQAVSPRVWAPERQPLTRQVCRLQAPAPDPSGSPASARPVALWPAGEGGEARKHRVPRAGCKDIVLETDAWKYRGRPGAPGKPQEGRSLLSGSGFWTRAGDLTPCASPAPRVPSPGPCSCPVVFDGAARRVLFQRAEAARCVCLIIN